MTTIRVFPGFNAVYYGYYVQGLFARFPTKEIVFTTKGFPKFGVNGLALVLEGTPSRKIYIHATDESAALEGALEWCDVYGKVNLDPDTIPPEQAHKVMAIGPSFGIRVWNPAATLWYALKHYTLCVLQGNSNTRKKSHFRNYYRQYRKRLPLSVYQPGVSSNSYVFFASLLRKYEHRHANEARALFIEACQTLDAIQLEGGFVRPPASYPVHDLDRFESLIFGERRYPLPEYLTRLKASAVAFSTPAVHRCLGWHLGEFLALGKAIISLPLTRKMPEPLVHGKHVHYVDGSIGSIREAVRLICQNREYRGELERNARIYYEKCLAPKRVIERILEAADAGSSLDRGPC
jgi:hypothetical protein